MLISPGDLSDMRRVSESGMDDTCLVERLTSVSDGMGGQSGSGWTTICSSVCRVRKTARDPRTKVVAERLGTIGIYEVVFPVGTPLKEGDRLTITPIQMPIPTRVMNVEAVLQSTHEAGRVCICTETLA